MNRKSFDIGPLRAAVDEAFIGAPLAALACLTRTSRTRLQAVRAAYYALFPVPILPT